MRAWMWFSEYYYIVLIIQALCIFHSVRKGNQQRWIYIIIFLPVIGSLIYIFTEVLRKDDVSNLQTGVAKIVNPTGKVKRLERNFQFSNTFANRIALADAYLEIGWHEKAIEMYEPALEGTFAADEHTVKQAIRAYYHVGNFEGIARIAPRISKSPNFSSSDSNLYYAFALEKMGKLAEAEREFKNMEHRFSNYEARYHYGCFLLRLNRKEDALAVFGEVVDEAAHMTWKEKKVGRVWINKCQEEFDKLVD
ncbi:MAG TPA: hypothetical protein VK177_13305 [Flavobacteriales bacterium]|nr:hypothetical protein [Flavobacteriales bacterium]